jgi:hypothetical protein
MFPSLPRRVAGFGQLVPQRGDGAPHDVVLGAPVISDRHRREAANGVIVDALEELRKSRRLIGRQL